MAFERMSLQTSFTTAANHNALLQAYDADSRKRGITFSGCPLELKMMTEARVRRDSRRSLDGSGKSNKHIIKANSIKLHWKWLKSDLD